MKANKEYKEQRTKEMLLKKGQELKELERLKKNMESDNGLDRKKQEIKLLL